MKITSIRRALLPGIALLALALSACGGADAGASTGDDGSAQSGKVAVDGSSTVFPMSDAAAELLLEEDPDVKVTVGESGTGGGFEAFCAGKTDISNASRPIKDEEAAVCKQAGIDYTELQVATDALTMVVHKDLDVDCLTVDQIVQLWGPGSQVKSWNELDPRFPEQEIALFGPGTDSGTYDYLAADVIGDDSESTRSDYESSEDDNVLVQGVGGTEGATGYFGYTYYEENTDTLKALAIDNGEGCVEPSAETAQDGSYAPLARPLFIYVNNAEYRDNEAVATYVDFYIENLSEIAEVGKFIPLSDELYGETRSALEGISG
ncbi:PstS family phosphate ABC transporter substrate-binding protein [Nocardioides sp. cx-169]|uniref:PstS family phosphate ABC transporter substrate-binding protein n=1 Tax=Nocardioides sp. cx-169 TaxID=2899080 RepID=UPI001E336D0C|nr:PstS family phosphate ABC transporter substrate-binding protein [Nocardioides sp. cx-169]MCD4533705.1 PstS family phosphate ABC transporter substrate-binding protein [Nocardioides sp. cx-169]